MEELKYWLALQRIAGVGPVLFNRLIEITGSPKAVFEYVQQSGAGLDISPITLSQLKNPDFSGLEDVLRWAEGTQNHVVTLNSPHYPELLRELPDAPPLLYIHGDASVLARKQLAIVGSRNPTSGGRDLAANFAYHLSQSEITVTSGLATGIDTAAHRGAVEASAATIAVMGTGIDRIYPARNRKLAHQIVEYGGALVSEFPLGTTPQRENFPQRNRIISGMSMGTLVVEAARRSGSLITARTAAEQGREVFAIPGSIHNPLAKGCHYLIRQGAKLVESSDDILEELTQLRDISSSVTDTTGQQIQLTPLDPEYQSVLTCVGFEPTAVDVVVSRSGLTASEVSSMLLVLELQDYLESHIGGLYSRKK